MKVLGSWLTVTTAMPRGSFEIFVDDHGVGSPGQVAHHRARVVAVAEGKELHEEPLVGALGPAILGAASLADVGWFNAGAPGGPRAFGWCLGHTVLRSPQS